jgi:tetratricopeptide (TPR) repeat protein
MPGFPRQSAHDESDAGPPGRSQYILICPNCRKRNLVPAEEALQAYTCGACHQVLLPEKRAPQETDPHRAFRLGLFLFDRRMLARARQEFQHAVRLKPANPLYHFWLGRCAYESFQFEKARQAFHGAATLRPGQSQFHFWVGQACTRLKRMDEAIVAFEQALELRPGHAATILRLALCHFRLKEYARCEALLSQKALSQSRSAELPLLLGMSRLMQADRRGAARALQAALRLRPGDQLIATYLQACRERGPLPSLRGLWRRLRGMKGAA